MIPYSFLTPGQARIIQPPKRNIVVPRFVILDVGEFSPRFLKQIRGFEQLLADEEQFAETILRICAYEKDAELELQYWVLDSVRNALGETHTKEVEAAAKATVDFGAKLLEQLHQLRLYRNGYLHYQFLKWLGDDLLLERLAYDPETGDE